MATKEKKNPKEKKVKLNVRGKLKAYLQTPLLLGLILALVNVWIYLVNVKAGIILTVFVVIYLVIIICMMIFKLVITSEQGYFVAQLSSSVYAPCIALFTKSIGAHGVAAQSVFLPGSG
ncbi:MAG: hypothetical protein IKM88_08095, partial [Lachnospiraceae bacterium]|nr:hypothetical protein [Lachnospiraceae bacterium]